MARVYMHGEIVGEPDPVIPLPDWVRSELDFAKKAFARAERDKCWSDTGALGGRISALKDVLVRLEKEAATEYARGYANAEERFLNEVARVDQCCEQCGGGCSRDYNHEELGLEGPG